MLREYLRAASLERLKRNPDLSFSQGFLFFPISDLFRLFQATQVKALSSSDQKHLAVKINSTSSLQSLFLVSC